MHWGGPNFNVPDYGHESRRPFVTGDVPLGLNVSGVASESGS